MLSCFIEVGLFHIYPYSFIYFIRLRSPSSTHRLIPISVTPVIYLAPLWCRILEIHTAASPHYLLKAVCSPFDTVILVRFGGALYRSCPPALGRALLFLPVMPSS